MFTTATVADKAAIDSLENALNNSFLAKTDPAVVVLSNAFEKSCNCGFSSYDTGSVQGGKVTANILRSLGPGGDH
jgi:hypothetical protein